MAYRIKGKFVSKAVYLESLGDDSPAQDSAIHQIEALADINALMASFPKQAVTGMVRRIETAYKEREAFEFEKSPNGSHIELRKARAIVMHNPRLAAFLLACDVDPQELLNKSRKEGTRANLKGIKKIKTLLDFVTGKSRVFERVSLALFASTIIAANRGIGWISNAEQELILSNLPVGSLPTELQAAVADYKHRYMSITGDSRNQSCQFRTTFSNLNCFFFSREDCDDMNRLGIMVNMDSPIIQFLNKRWNLDAVS